jgi:quercetin dioxygenase-like cupin family protein
MNNPEIIKSQRNKSRAEHPTHAADWTPVTLVAAGAGLMERARAARNGHASQLLIGGAHQRAVLMALTNGSSLGEHESPPSATFQVVTGQARLYAVGGPECVVSAGEVVAIPPERHGVAALEDCVILLTVALNEPPPAP